MAQAKVISLDAIKQFRAALVKFAEAVNSSLGNADSDVNRALTWLDMEAKSYWQGQIRKAQTKLGQANEALRMKVLYKNMDGTTPSAVDEKKEVAKWKARVEVCETKLRNVQRYSNLIQRESVLYKGAVQRFGTTIQSGTPRALATLDRVLSALDRYLTAQPEAATIPGAVSVDTANPVYQELMQSMARAEADEKDGSQISGLGSRQEEPELSSRDPKPETRDPSSETPDPNSP